MAGVHLSWLTRWTVWPGRAARTFTFPRVWFWSCFGDSTQCEVMISHSFAVKIHFYGNGRCALILAGTVSVTVDDQFVRLYSWLLDCDASCNSSLMQCEVIISPLIRCHNTGRQRPVFWRILRVVGLRSGDLPLSTHKKCSGRSVVQID